MKTKKFTFKLTYFKPTGKFYSNDSFEAEVRVCEGTTIPYMPDIVAKVRGWRDTRGQRALPGLSGEGWDGFILVDCEDGYPCLIKPNKETTNDT